MVYATHPALADISVKGPSNMRAAGTVALAIDLAAFTEVIRCILLRDSADSRRRKTIREVTYLFS